MIIEALKHFFYPAELYKKKMGYLRETIAIEARYKRCAPHWMPHLNKCKSLILKAAEKLPDKAHIMIVGSGGLHDIPMDELIEKSMTITCVDIIHLPYVKRAYPSVTFVEKDITELAEPLYQSVANGKFNIETFTPEWIPEQKPDLIISLNILSQLPMTLVSYAKAKQIALPENFELNIRKCHIHWLKKAGHKNLLITDIKRNYFHKGELIQSDSALVDGDYELFGTPQEQWIWNIAPVGETEKDIGIEHQVGVWRLIA